MEQSKLDEIRDPARTMLMVSDRYMTWAEDIVPFGMQRYVAEELWMQWHSAARFRIWYDGRPVIISNVDDDGVVMLTIRGWAGPVAE